jgi:hypothetical protein
VGLDTLQPMVEAFYLGSYSTDVKNMLDQSGVEYIWFGPDAILEQKMMENLGLVLEYDQDGLQIYSISSEGLDD